MIKHRAVKLIKSRNDNFKELSDIEFKRRYSHGLYYKLREQKVIRKDEVRALHLTEKGEEYYHHIVAKEKIKVSNLSSEMIERLSFSLQNQNFTKKDMADNTNSNLGLITDFFRNHMFLYDVDKSKKAYSFTLKEKYIENVQLVLGFSFD